jgi:RNA polymerase sigma-70 factor (ECF subfamily)
MCRNFFENLFANVQYYLLFNTGYSTQAIHVTLAQKNPEAATLTIGNTRAFTHYSGNDVKMIRPNSPNKHTDNADKNALDDNNVMTRIRDGDIEQLAVLFERYHVRLYNFFVKHTGQRGKGSAGEDLTQDVFLRILKYRHTFNNDAPFTVWMYKIARNVAADFFAQQKPVSSLSAELADTLGGDDAAREFDRREDEHVLHHALARLEPERREVLILSRFEGLKYEEIAAIQGVQVGTVKSRVHHALNDLRTQFQRLSRESVHNTEHDKLSHDKLSHDKRSDDNIPDNTTSLFTSQNALHSIHFTDR